MITIDEGKLRFGFDDEWIVCEKWDASRVYAEGLKTLCGELDERAEGTKAVDFVGVRGGVLHLIEVKDFRGHRIENTKRQRKELPLEVGLKVRDTLAGVAGAYFKGGGPTWVERCGDALAARKKQVHVVVWIADDPVGPREPQSKRDMRDDVRRKQVEQKLAWLTARIHVEDPFATRLPGATAENLPGAGRG